jgi:bacteriocin-like protein
MSQDTDRCLNAAVGRSSALQDGFHAVSAKELEQIEGGVVIAIIAILIGLMPSSVSPAR